MTEDNVEDASMATVRLTAAQAMVRFLAAQYTEVDGEELPLFAGVFAIFGHGNVAGLGEALYHAQEELPTYRAHNEQGMAHAAIAFAKANNRRRMMACTTSIGPGATNMVTAAALAHVNRLPVLLIPGDTFANRRPDPVLQQVEDFCGPTVTANDCFRPVSRYFDRITRPEQLITSLPQAINVLTDPANCGPATIAFSQDVQAEAYDYPESFFEKRVHRPRRVRPDENELAAAISALKQAKKPFIVAGGGVQYSGSVDDLKSLVEETGLPVGETQAGKGTLPWNHPQSVGAVGVTGTSAANDLAAEADVILAVGTRLQDFTTASRSLFRHPNATLIQLNVAAFDAAKHGATPLVADAKVGLSELLHGLEGYDVPVDWKTKTAAAKETWEAACSAATAAGDADLPSDAQVLGAVNRQAGETGTVVCAAGGLPGELHKNWRADGPDSYHLEYGYSCMGYEIAGGLGVKMAKPERDVTVLVGDGSYMMMNSEIATSVMLGHKLTIVVLDNRGFGCINRLQQACGGAGFNNLLKDARHEVPSDIDFARHAGSMGAISEKVSGIAELEAALARAKSSDRTHVIVIDTDPLTTTGDGGAWWDVAVPEVSERAEVKAARSNYEKAISKQKVDR